MFRDRADAGERLGAAVRDALGDADGFAVLGIPRGGVVVGAEVARVLGLPLAPVHAVKIRAPWNRELAIGAVAEGIEPIIDPDWAGHPRLAEDTIARALQSARADLDARQRIFGSAGDVAGRLIIMVDDGAATGYTTLAAARSLRAARVSRLVGAIPVSSQEARNMLRRECDDLVILEVPRIFMAVGQFYQSFEGVAEAEVLRLLAGSPSDE